MEWGILMSFDVKKDTAHCIKWIKEWFRYNSGGATGILVNISGGVDSTVVAKLCVDAIGNKNIFGLLQPNGTQSDINDSEYICKLLGIPYDEINIANQFQSIKDADLSLSNEALINVAPRIRMINAYAKAQTMGYRVAGTGNLSERYIGWTTKWGDSASDFNPIFNFTKTEVIAIGDYLGLPHNLIHKIPMDGLCGVSDEEKFGFSYEELDKYIRTGVCENVRLGNKIIVMNRKSEHKRIPVPSFTVSNSVHYTL